MNDLRYLGFTVIAIFLALAIGLMTGSALGSPDRQATAFEGLRKQFEELRDQNQEVRDESEKVRRRISVRDQAIRDLIPLAVRDRLPSSTIGVILCGAVDERPFWGELEGVLRTAGARIGPIVRIPDTPRVLSAALRARFAGMWEPGEAPAEPSRLEPAGWVVRALTQRDQSDRLQELARETGIELRGDYAEPVHRILIITGVGDDTRAEAIAAGDVPEKWAVDAGLNEQGLRLVVAEPEETHGSAVEPISRRNVPTVDNLDTPAGQIAVVLALAGADGHFGSKPGAQRALPSLEP